VEDRMGRRTQNEARHKGELPSVRGSTSFLFSTIQQFNLFLRFRACKFAYAVDHIDFINRIISTLGLLGRRISLRVKDVSFWSSSVFLPCGVRGDETYAFARRFASLFSRGAGKVSAF